jgi:arsenate reductase
VDLVAKLEDPTTELVRRDANFTKLGLTDADVDTPEQVIDILVQHPALLQRPILVKGDVAIIGRPKDRVPTFLGA